MPNQTQSLTFSPARPLRVSTTNRTSPEGEVGRQIEVVIESSVRVTLAGELALAYTRWEDGGFKEKYGKELAAFGIALKKILKNAKDNPTDSNALKALGAAVLLGILVKKKTVNTKTVRAKHCLILGWLMRIVVSLS